MDVRLVMERTQALNMFWEREIDKYLKLKPSAMITKEEVVSMQENLQTQKSGVSQLDVGDLWKGWTNGYKELVKLASDTTKDNSRQEIHEIYGVTTSLPRKETGAGASLASRERKGASE